MTDSLSSEFLTAEESAEVDRALMTSRDRFSTRVAIYSLRSLKQAAADLGITVRDLTPEQIEDWVYQDPSLSTDQGFDSAFKSFFVRLVASSLTPLAQAAAVNQVAIEQLTLSQVIQWFEQEAKRRIEQEP